MLKRRRDLEREYRRHFPAWLTAWQVRGARYQVANPFCGAFWRENWETWGSLYGIRYYLLHPVRLWWKD